jgi:hypothetical protein
MTFNMQDLNSTKAHTGTRVTPDAGDYVVMISKSETADGKKSGSLNAVMEYTIISDGPFTGAVVKEWLAIVNSSEQAQNIARSKLRAVQVTSKSENAQTINDMVGKQIIIRVNKEENEYVDSQGNRRKGFQNNVINYMDMKRKDADGKDVPAFVAQAPKPASDAQFSSTRQAQTTGSAADNDDEIPF